MSSNQLGTLLEQLGLTVTRQRKNELEIICPWHDDKTPSLHVNVEKMVYLCRAGCAKGRVTTLIKKLAGPFSYKYLPFLYEITPEQLDEELSPDEFITLPDFTYFNSLKSATCNVYLKNRQINNHLIEKFDIRENSQSIFLPIYSTDVYLNHYKCARITNGDHEFCGYIERNYNIRYKNSPGFTVTNHFYPNLVDNTLYNEIILVEGAFDFLKLYDAGVTNTLALLGTNLSDIKFKILLSITKKVVLCLDNDMPGKIATSQLYERLSSKNIDVEIITLPNNIKDIAELPLKEIQHVIKNRR